MIDRLKPRDGKDVEDAVRWALAEGKALEIAGQAPSVRSAGRRRPMRRSISPGSRA